MLTYSTYWALITARVSEYALTQTSISSSPSDQFEAIPVSAMLPCLSVSSVIRLLTVKLSHSESPEALTV